MPDSGSSEAESKSLQERVTKYAVLLGAAGSVWFAIMSLMTAWVYEPVGVAPRDLGLSTSSLLTQATIGLLAFGFLGLLVGAIVGGIWGVVSASRDAESKALAQNVPLPFVVDDAGSNAEAAARLKREADMSQEEAETFVQEVHEHVEAARVKEIRTVLPSGVDDDEAAALVGKVYQELPRQMLQAQIMWISLVFGAFTGLAIAVFAGLGLLAIYASDTREAIQEGRAHNFVLGLPSPWTATIANVKPLPGGAATTVGGVPGCVLFLGQNDSTIFLRASGGPTLRIPAGSVRLDLTDDESCG